MFSSQGDCLRLGLFSLQCLISSEHIFPKINLKAHPNQTSLGWSELFDPFRKKIEKRLPCGGAGGGVPSMNDSERYHCDFKLWVKLHEIFKNPTSTPDNKQRSQAEKAFFFFHFIKYFCNCNTVFIFPGIILLLTPFYLTKSLKTKLSYFMVKRLGCALLHFRMYPSLNVLPISFMNFSSYLYYCKNVSLSFML